MLNFITMKTIFKKEVSYWKIQSLKTQKNQIHPKKDIMIWGKKASWINFASYINHKWEIISFWSFDN